MDERPDPSFGDRERPERTALRPGYARIPMSDYRDAMDCSLALTSQEIVHHVKGSEAVSGGYYLTVKETDYRQAQDTVERFRRENRASDWRPPPVLTQTPLLFSWAGFIWCLLLGIFGYLPTVRPAIREGGILDSELVADGQIWRILTATMLHDDVAHLFSNLSLGVLFFGLMMGRFGVGPGLLGILLTGAAGNLFGLLMHDEPYRGLGASGAVMGALGMLGPHAIRWIRQDPRAYRIVVGSLMAVVMLFAWFGFSPHSDVMAHTGGFLAGLVLGVILGLVDERELKRTRWNALGSLVALAALLSAWGVALN